MRERFKIGILGMILLVLMSLMLSSCSSVAVDTELAKEEAQDAIEDTGTVVEAVQEAGAIVHEAAGEVVEEVSDAVEDLDAVVEETREALSDENAESSDAVETEEAESSESEEVFEAEDLDSELAVANRITELLE